MHRRSTPVRHAPLPRVALVLAGAFVTLAATSAMASGRTTSAGMPSARVWIRPHAIGALDCNGLSRIQRNAETARACTDIRGIVGVRSRWLRDGRFYDNGRYIGHDEPDTRFLSALKGSGHNVTWRETLSTDPSGAPTVKTPGHDRTHYVELSLAPWFSMALCKPLLLPVAAVQT